MLYYKGKILRVIGRPIFFVFGLVDRFKYL